MRWQRACILAAVAPGEMPASDESLDIRILETAGLLAERLESKLHVFHAFTPPVFGGAGMALGETAAMASVSNDLFADREEEQRKAVADLLRRSGVTGAEVTLSPGAPKHRLPAFAGAVDATLTVMGAVSRSMIERAVIGSTAESTLDRLPSDLLIIK